jgi:hypothetical protein
VPWNQNTAQLSIPGEPVRLPIESMAQPTAESTQLNVAIYQSISLDQTLGSFARRPSLTRIRMPKVDGFFGLFSIIPDSTINRMLLNIPEQHS